MREQMNGKHGAARVTVREAFDAGIEAHRRSRWRQRGVSALYWACMLALGLACARSVESAYELALVVPVAYAADAITAAVHVYFDHRQVRADGAVSERWLSRELDRAAYGFQVHHVDPMRFVRGMELTGQYGQLEILVLATIPLYLSTALVPFRLLALAMHATNALGSATQVIHAYTHLPVSQVPIAARWAQAHGLLL